MQVSHRFPRFQGGAQATPPTPLAIRRLRDCDRDSPSCSEFSMGRLTPTQEPPHEVATEAEDQHLPGLAQGPAPITRARIGAAERAITPMLRSVLFAFQGGPSYMSLVGAT